MQRAGVTLPSTDPKVATAFATRAAEYGESVLHVATSADLAGLKVELHTGYLAYEAEAYVGTTAADFAARSSITVSAGVARDAFGDRYRCAYAIYSNEDLTSYLRNTPLMAPVKIEKFIARLLG